LFWPETELRKGERKSEIARIVRAELISIAEVPTVDPHLPYILVVPSYRPR
jgi:hypothetical protein